MRTSVGFQFLRGFAARVSPVILCSLLAACGSAEVNDGSTYVTRPLAHLAFEQAQRALDAGDLGTAASKIEEAARDDPDSPKILALQGRILEHLDRLEEARFALETLLEKYPGYERGWLSLGNVMMRQNQFRDAVEAYRQELSREKSPAAYYNLALAYNALDATVEARAAIESALTLDPRYANGYAALADLEEKSGDYEAALANARRAAELTPDSNRFREKMGYLLLRSGRLDEALALLAEMVERQPWNYQTRYNLGQALQRAGRADEAEAELTRAEADRTAQGSLRRMERAIKRDPRNGRLQFALGIEYQKWGRLEDALRAYRIAQQLMPDDLLVQMNVATLYLHRKEFGEATERLRRIVAKDSTFAAAWLNLGFAEARIGNESQARRAWERATVLKPEYRATVAAFQERIDSVL